MFIFTSILYIGIVLYILHYTNIPYNKCSITLLCMEITYHDDNVIEDKNSQELFKKEAKNAATDSHIINRVYRITTRTDVARE